MPDYEYSFRVVDSVLSHYKDILAGECAIIDFDKTGSHNIFRAPFETISIVKADIDSTIDRMGIPGAWSDYCATGEAHSLTPRQKRIIKYINDPQCDKQEIPVGIIHEITNRLNGVFTDPRPVHTKPCKPI